MKKYAALFQKLAQSPCDFFRQTWVIADWKASRQRPKIERGMSAVIVPCPWLKKFDSVKMWLQVNLNQTHVFPSKSLWNRFTGQHDEVITSTVWVREYGNTSQIAKILSLIWNKYSFHLCLFLVSTRLPLVQRCVNNSYMWWYWRRSLWVVVCNWDRNISLLGGDWRDPRDKENEK